MRGSPSGNRDVKNGTCAICGVVWTVASASAVKNRRVACGCAWFRGACEYQRPREHPPQPRLATIHHFSLAIRISYHKHRTGGALFASYRQYHGNLRGQACSSVRSRARTKIIGSKRPSVVDSRTPMASRCRKAWFGVACTRVPRHKWPPKNRYTSQIDQQVRSMRYARAA